MGRDNGDTALFPAKPVVVLKCESAHFGDLGGLWNAYLSLASLAFFTNVTLKWLKIVEDGSDFDHFWVELIFMFSSIILDTYDCVFHIFKNF